MIEPTYLYRCVATNVVDGDTLDVVIDLGFHMSAAMRVRLYGIDTPERGQPGHEEARDFVRVFVGLSPSVIPSAPFPLLIETYKSADKYGRWLGRVSRRDVDMPTEVNDLLVTAGLAVPYFGGKKL